MAGLNPSYTPAKRKRLFDKVEKFAATGMSTNQACIKAGISDARYYSWRKYGFERGATSLHNRKAKVNYKALKAAPVVVIGLTRAAIASELIALNQALWTTEVPKAELSDKLVKLAQTLLAETA